MADAVPEEIIQELNLCLTKLANSTATYILESNPFTSGEDKNAIAALQEMSVSDRSQMADCAALIERLEGVPRTGVADPMLAELNYLSYPYLVDVLIRDLEHEIAHYTASVKKVEAVPEVKTFLQSVLDARQAQIKKLREIRQKSYAAPQAVPQAASA